MKKITVLDDYQGGVSRLQAVDLLADLDVELNILTAHSENETELVAALHDTDCLVLIRERTKITAAVVAQLPQLELIVQTGRLAGAIDLEACRQRGILVREGSGNAIAPAELTWALIMAASRGIVPYSTGLAAGRWQRTAETIEGERLGRSLYGRSLCVWGLGRVGLRVASYGRVFGMQVLIHGREQSRVAAEREGYHYVAERAEFLAAADVLTLHLRLCKETLGLIGGGDFAQMKSTALFVNTSRAELVAPGALQEAIAQGRPGGAALDVFENEPLGAVDYLKLPTTLCTPHIGFVEQDTYEQYFREAFGHVRNHLLGLSG